MGKDYIKFNINWIKEQAFPKEKIEELNSWRNKMSELGLIGAYENGIGFGNISKRTQKNKFIISGSATGNLKELTREHYSEVTEFDLTTNSLSCVGPIKASSESLTHAAIYSNAKEVNAVIHVHNLKLWKHLYNRIPGTKKEVKYGTVEMAEEMKRLLQEKETKEKKIIVMKGHKEGLVSFGKDLDEAGKIMLKYFNQANSNSIQ